MEQKEFGPGQERIGGCFDLRECKRRRMEGGKCFASGRGTTGFTGRMEVKE